MSKTYDCGCVENHYWCSKHDIYNRQKANDMPPHTARVRVSEQVADCCSCHVLAPCSYCIEKD